MKRILFAAAIVLSPWLYAAPPEHDVVVYGGTSGGVIAAVQAAKSGKSVVLVSPTPHLGGLSSSGLGYTDLGDVAILGGLSREFYHRLYLHYQKDEAWKWEAKNLGMAGQGAPGFDAKNEVASLFEPSVAESVYKDLIAEAGVNVVTGKLDVAAGVVMDGKRIARLRLEDGREFPGTMFIDCSYEGDLLPGAGVSFTIGREANATHGENINGIQTALATKNQIRSGIDPYVIPGDPSSGLLPGVNPDAGGADGSADHRLQAFCFRMVLTDKAENRVMIPQPSGYNPTDYELLFRAIEAGQSGDFFKLSRMPNRKTDSNNAGGMSNDFIGMNYGPDWNWATLNHDQRDAIAKKHENWQRGLVWTLQNHPRVPQSIRDFYAPWGLPADEFTDNGHWPWQIYVREARRMVADVVMAENHCRGSLIVEDSVGLAAYTMDSHHVQRHVKNGQVRNEGDVQVMVPGPYPISYRAIVPAKGECANLLVPWCLSASHMAFGSIRMEPVFMGLAQSAAIAATLAIDRNLEVQDLPYTQLRPALLAAGQALGPEVEPTVTPETIIDNTDASAVTITGAWTASSSVTGYHGPNYLHDSNAGQGTKEVFFRLAPASPGLCRVYLRWTADSNRASNVPVTIRHAKGVTNYTINQRTMGGRWNVLGIHSFSGGAGEGLTIKTTGANGYVVVDAVGYLPVDPALDSDRDGLSDLQELDLGLDPLVSDDEFIAAVRRNPEVFGLHSADEIHDLKLSGPALRADGQAGLTLGFALQSVDGTNNRIPLETFELPVGREGDKAFFRLAAASKPAGFITALAAGTPRKIVVYGTSLTAGGVWPSHLASWLSARHAGTVTLINSGMAGQNSYKGVQELSSRVLAHNPDVVFIEFAMNDAFRYPANHSSGNPALSVAEARANLETMIDAILARNPEAEIILQTMNTVWNSPTGSNESATMRPDLASYYQMYRDVAAERGLMIIDHASHWADLQARDRTRFEAFVPDGVHPTAAGQDAILLPLLKWRIGGGRILP